MTLLRAACIQMRSSTEVAPNIAAASDRIRAAAMDGARFVATPEMTNIVDIRPGHARPKIRAEADDASLAALSALAQELGITLLIGSLAIGLPDDDRFANRSYLIGPEGKILARYDKIHMFDVEVGDGQSYRAGDRSVEVNAPAGRVHVLIRARAIESGSFVLAPAQGGRHEDGRETYGHSLIVSPWGEVLAEAAHDAPGYILADLDLEDVATARARIPALGNDQAFVFGEG